jgi:Protein of unknown function (DUF3300)
MIGKPTERGEISMAEAARIISIATLRYRVPAVAAAFALLAAGPGADLTAFAQQAPQQAQQVQQQFSVEQINQLVAPIALYPDNLLGQILAASTYPLEIVVAARWSSSNQNVTGQPLEDAMQLQSWDPSVKALCAVPQVLQMMSEKVEWTQQLGAAYQAQPDDIAAAVQRLRARADASGNLKETNQVKVRRVAAPPPPPAYVGEPLPPEYIVIEPYDPGYLYVPVYDPWVVYGVWPYPAWRPFYWYPPGYVAVGIIGFGAPIFVGSAIWATYRWGSWGGGVHVNVVKYNQWNKTKIVSTGGSVPWNNKSQQFKSVNKISPGMKTGPGGQQIRTTKFTSGNTGTVGSQRHTNFNNPNGGKPSGQTFQGKPQGIAGINPSGGSKTPKITSGNTVRTNLANTQRVNVGQNFRGPTNFKPAPRVQHNNKKP